MVKQPTVRKNLTVATNTSLPSRTNGLTVAQERGAAARNGMRVGPAFCEVCDPLNIAHMAKSGYVCATQKARFAYPGAAVEAKRGATI